MNLFVLLPAGFLWERERLRVMLVGCWVFRSLFIRLPCEEISFTGIGISDYKGMRAFYAKYTIYKESQDAELPRRN